MKQLSADVMWIFPNIWVNGAKILDLGVYWEWCY